MSVTFPEQPDRRANSTTSKAAPAVAADPVARVAAPTAMKQTRVVCDSDYMFATTAGVMNTAAGVLDVYWCDAHTAKRRAAFEAAGGIVESLGSPLFPGLVLPAVRQGCGQPRRDLTE